jgi:hypothetical protein
MLREGVDNSESTVGDVVAEIDDVIEETSRTSLHKAKIQISELTVVQYASMGSTILKTRGLQEESLTKVV